MRKALNLILILFCTCFCIYAVSKYTREMNITGYYLEYCDVSVTPLHNLNALDTTEGFPFDLLGDDIVENTDATGGRLIGYWQMNSNTSPTKVEIKAHDLTFTGDTAEELPYVLRFAYAYPCYTSDESYYIKNGFIYVASEGLDDEKTKVDDNKKESDSFLTVKNSSLQLNHDYTSSAYGINLAEGEIRFILPVYYSDLVKTDEYPAGTYTATVELTVSGS